MSAKARVLARWILSRPTIFRPIESTVQPAFRASQTEPSALSSASRKKASGVTEPSGRRLEAGQDLEFEERPFGRPGLDSGARCFGRRRGNELLELGGPLEYVALQQGGDRGLVEEASDLGRLGLEGRQGQGEGRTPVG